MGTRNNNSPQTRLHDLQEVIGLLTNQTQFRKNLTEALFIICRNLNADTALFIETIPSLEDSEKFTFHRILEVSAIGSSKEYDIPSALLSKNFHNQRTIKWVNSLKHSAQRSSTKKKKSQKPTANDLAVIKDQLSKNYTAKILMKAISFEFSSFLLFPLYQEETIRGFLFFSSTALIQRTKETLSFTSSCTQILTNLLASQQVDNMRIIKQNFLQQPQVPLSTPSPNPAWKEKEQLSNHIASIIPNHIFLVDVEQGKAIFANNTIFLGYDIAKRKDPLEIFATIVHPDDQAIAIMEFILQLKDAKDGEIISCEYRMRHKDGYWVWINERAKIFKRFPNGVVKQYITVMQDVTEKKNSLLKIKESIDLLKAILNTLPDTKLRINYQGKILAIYSSLKNKKDTTVALEGQQEKNLESIYPAFVAKGLLFNARKALDTQKLQTFEFINSSGNEIQYIEARINSINLDEAIIIIRNITPLKLAEKAVNEQIKKSDREKRQLEKYIESNLQLENFAYIASHDLREPLRTIHTFGQFLDKRIGKKLDEDSRSYLDFIISGANRMNQLIESLLAYSRVDTDPRTREAIETQDLLTSIINGLRTRIDETKAQIIIKNIPPIIYGSPVRIEQVFQNLIANAIKFHQDSIPPIVTITCKENPTHWRFSIQDNGIGIKEEFFDRIFAIFKKLHNHQAYQGTGIGLALVKRIIGQQGGEVWLKSEEGVGTTFYFTLLK